MDIFPNGKIQIAIIWGSIPPFSDKPKSQIIGWISTDIPLCPYFVLDKTTSKRWYKHHFPIVFCPNEEVVGSHHCWC